MAGSAKPLCKIAHCVKADIQITMARLGANGREADLADLGLGGAAKFGAKVCDTAAWIS